MPLLTSPQGAQTPPPAAWFVDLWIPTHPRDPQDQLCASSWILAELSALHHTLIVGGTRGRGVGQGCSAAARVQETQLTGGEVLSVEPLTMGKGGHLIHSNPHHTRGLMLGYSMDTTLAKPSCSGCNTAVPELKGVPGILSSTHTPGLKSPSLPQSFISSPGQARASVAVPKPRCWA